MGWGEGTEGRRKARVAEEGGRTAVGFGLGRRADGDVGRGWERWVRMIVEGIEEG